MSDLDSIEQSIGLTDSDLESAYLGSVAGAAISIAMALYVIIASAWVYRSKAGRLSLNRISFRLMLWTMVFEVAYGVAFLALDAPIFVPEANCVASMYFMLSSMTVVNYLCTSIAINLMLTISFGLDPIALGLEKWYIGVPIFLGLVIEIAPAALGHFGTDPVIGGCWFTAADQDVRRRDFILDIYLWQCLSCLIALVAVSITLFTLARQGGATSRFLMDLSGDSFKPCTRRGVFGRVVCYVTKGKRCCHQTISSSSLGHLQDRLFTVAMRIAMYPIVLITINVIITVGDLYLSNHDVDSIPTIALYQIYCFLYGARGGLIALLGIFVDPSLNRGIRIAWKHRNDVDYLPSTTGSSSDTHFNLKDLSDTHNVKDSADFLGLREMFEKTGTQRELQVQILDTQLVSGSSETVSPPAEEVGMSAVEEGRCTDVADHAEEANGRASRKRLRALLKLL